MGRAAVLGAMIVAFAAAPARAADWTTFGFDLARTAQNPHEAAFDPAGLTHRWSFDLGGVVNAQPLYAAGTVYAGSESGQLAALDAATGVPRWTRQLTAVDTICEDVPEGIHGISATPTLDTERGTIWAAGGDGRVWAIDMATGEDREGWPVQVGGRNEHVWGALALRGNRLYVATSSHCNNAFYRGRVAAIHPDTGKKRAEWRPLPRGRYGGGVWGWGGVVVDADSGDVFIGTANGQGRAAHKPYAEHVVRLSSKLEFEQANDPGPPQRDDNDFTGAPVLFRVDGCPPQMAIMHKTGRLFVYDRRRVKRGPMQRIKAGSLEAFVGLGTYAWSQERRMLYLANGSAGKYVQGLVALRLYGDCRFRRAWEQPVGTDPTWPTVPVVAGAAVLFGDGSQKTLHAFRADTGAPLWNSGDVTGDLYGAPIVAGGWVFAPSWDDKVHAWGPG